MESSDNVDAQDRFDLQRFLEAQEGSYDRALAEIRRGAKRSHWMWYVFPQIAGLGSSPTAQRFSITSLDEARSYLRHPVLGAHFHECVEALMDLTGTTAEQVFGAIDAIKLRSSLTLFGRTGDMPICEAALARWCGGPDEATLRILDGLESG